MGKKRSRRYSGKKLEEFSAEIDGLEILVERKRIKYIHIRISPENGRVSLSIPEKVGMEEVTRLVRNRMEWIQKNRENILKKHPESGTRYEDGDVFRLWGKDLRLKVKEIPAKGGSRSRLQLRYLSGRTVEQDVTDFDEEVFLFMEVPEGTKKEERQKLMDRFYRRQMERMIPKLAARCEARTGLNVEEWRIRRMKTRWGSCNWKAKRIWLNLQLASMEPVYLEYVMIHELCHLLEPSHNAHFYELMDRFAPGWKEIRKRMR